MVRSVVLLCRLLFVTLRMRILESQPHTSPYSRSCQQTYIYPVWHDVLLISMFGGRHTRMAALVSMHQDGSFLAQGLERLGVRLVRGSSSRSGAAAVRTLLSLPRETHIVLTPDGPRGPRHEAKVGVAFIASHSGRAIVPTAFAATRAWKVSGSWSDLAIPKPFATVFALCGAPIQVPTRASSTQLRDAQAAVQTAMERLTDLADRLGSGQIKQSDVQYVLSQTTAAAG